MFIQIVADQLVVRLTKADWQVANGVKAMKFVEELKKEIPMKDRVYNSQEKTWYLPPAYIDLVHQIKDEVFADKRQAELF